MTSWIRNVGRNAVDPLDRIQLDRGCACPWIGRGFQDQAAVVELFERIHGQYGPGDIPGLGFNRSDLSGIDRRSRVHGKSRVTPRITGSA
jgi:hypothetical protein